MMALAMIAAVTSFWAWSRTRDLRREVARTERAIHNQERDLHLSESRLSKARDELTATDSDNQRLIDAISAGAIPTAVVPLQPQLTHENIAARFKRGQAREAAGDLAGALADYLWCYDIGYRGGDPLRRIAALAKKFAAAEQALLARRELAEQSILSDPDDVETMNDVVALNQHLGDNARTLAIYDRLPRGAVRGEQHSRAMLEVFLSTRRYADAAQVLPYELLKQGLERSVKMDEMRGVRANAQQRAMAAEGSTPAQQQMQAVAIERARRAQRVATITETAVGIEILAGAGDVPHAEELVRGLLAYDGTEETRTLLEKHLSRAGHPEILARERAPAPNPR
jgi:hypothetical protein